MKKYKNLQIAFLIEIFVGFGTILSISIIGPKALAALAVLALRPIILEKEIIKDEKTYFQFFYKIIQSSLSIIFINAFVAFLFFRKKLKTKLFSKFTSEDVSNLTAYLVPSYVSILVNFFNYRLTIWQVNYYEGTENLGYFSLALNFAQMMLLVTLSLIHI